MTRAATDASRRLPAAGTEQNRWSEIRGPSRPPSRCNRDGHGHARGAGCRVVVGGDAEGRGGVGPVTLFDAQDFATRIAAELKGFDLSRELGDGAARWEGHARNTKIALAAASQAVRDSGLFDGKEIDRARFGVYLGAGEGQMDFPRFVDLVHRSSAGGKVDRRRFTGLGIGARCPSGGRARAGHAGGAPRQSLRGRGPNLSCLTACSASAQAIGEAAELIRCGAADVMLAGGVHSMIHPFGMTGFILLTAMSTRNDDPDRASRPFDRDRDGFVIGEGGGMVVLEVSSTRGPEGRSFMARSPGRPRRPTPSPDRQSR